MHDMFCVLCLCLGIFNPADTKENERLRNDDVYCVAVTKRLTKGGGKTSARHQSIAYSELLHEI